MQTEQAAMLGKHSLDAFGRENLGKWQSLAGQKRIHNLLKTAAVSAWPIWYLWGHESSDGHHNSHATSLRSPSAKSGPQNVVTHSTANFFRSSVLQLSNIAGANV
jgi:hypothetical protein